MNPFLLLVPLAAIVAGLANRRRVSRDTETSYRVQFAPHGEAIVPGAEGYVLEGSNGRTLLMLHGSGDTPQSLRYLADRINAAGYTVHAPLLPGHGRSPRAFARATSAEYYAAARAAYGELRGKPWVGLVGLSMGGALLARVASEEREVRALVLLAPYLGAPGLVRFIRRAGMLWSAGVPYVRGGGDTSIHDPVARAESRAYGSFSRGALTALLETADAGRRALSRITAPVLVVNSANDNRIPRDIAEAALRELPVSTEQHWVEGCGHVITVDYCKDEVVRLVLAFLARHAG
ncbi:MAG: alpha/beta fold hydrolase [Gemmatimonadaceae bacterium]